MATMFKKPKRNFRRKVANSDSDQEQNEESEAMDTEDSRDSVASTVSVDTEKKKKSGMRKVPSALLSFGDHIDEGAYGEARIIAG